MISVVIITYQRKADCENLVAQLLNYGEGIIDDIVVVNNSPELPLNLQSSIVSVSHNVKNLGVSVSRNMGLDRAKNNIVWFLDDDTVVPRGLNSQLLLLEVYFNSVTKLACLATKVTGLDGEIRKKEVPFIKSCYSTEFIRHVSYFVGASFFVKKGIFQELGGFDIQCFYGFEETDFSFKLLKNNYILKYYPYIEIVHLGNPAGRLPSALLLQNIFINRVRIVGRHLPFVFLLSHSAVWYLYYIFKHKVFLKLEFSRSNNIPSVNPGFLKYLLKTGGRLFY